MRGQITKIISNDFTVTSNKEYVCKSRGKFRNMGITPIVGDIVEFNEIDHYILEVLPRKNELLRPPIANVDQALIITSLKDPDFSPNLLDKLLVIIEYHNIEPIIVLTKADKLINKDEMEHIKLYYENLNYQVYYNYELDKIRACLKNKVSVLTGQSGAGKSTLINSIDTNFHIKTDEISFALGRGKHTTRHVELLETCQGLVADTPGFSSLTFYDMEETDIKDQFRDFNEVREQCEYKDCMHIKEKDCEVKRKVENGEILKSRYNDYLNFIDSKKRR